MSRKPRAVSHEGSTVSQDMEIATLGGGCFWCIEAIFDDLKGVELVESGYSGGTRAHPTYQQVCTGTTGHAEAAQITFDPTVISFRDLLRIFFTVHDPTTLNRQGPDVGTQYRSAIYTVDDAQGRAAAASRELYQQRLRAAGFGTITTEVAPAPPFFYAEDYHQQYLAKNPGGYCGIGGTGVTCQAGLHA
jgi:peptide-methionine (S)-S-oxide reductase